MTDIVREALGPRDRRSARPLIDPGLVLGTLPVAIVLLDHECRFLFANQAAEQFFGASASHLWTLRLADLLPSDNPLFLLLEQVRTHEATRRVPIVVVAGGNLSLSADDAKLVDDLVQKPFDIDVMLNAVRKALGDPIVEIQPRQYDAQDYFLHGY